MLLISLVSAQFSNSQVRQVRFEQLDSLQAVQQRPVIVFLHTAWCKFCNTMKNTTFKNKEIQDLLNNKFYFLALDVEHKQDIAFRGHSFKYKPTGTTSGVHELAEQLGSMEGELAYPTMSFLNPGYQITFQRAGFIPAKELLGILKKLQ